MCSCRVIRIRSAARRRQLIAAKLNIGYGSDPSLIAATSTLDRYNNGLLTTICVP